MSSLVLSRAGRLNLRAAEDLFPSLTHVPSSPPPPFTLRQCLPGRNALLFDIYPAMHIHGGRNAVARVPLALLRPRATSERIVHLFCDPPREFSL